MSIAETIRDLILIIVTAAASGVTGWYISLRKLRPEIQDIQARSEKARAEAWKELTDAYRERMEILNRRISEQDKVIDDLRCEVEKIKESRRHTAEENDKLRDKVRELEICASHITALEERVIILSKQIVELGHKPITGPLKEK